MESWPEFVTDEEPSRRTCVKTDLTGWETVIFEVEDQDSDSCTAALAP
jgi:hypothetical protein